MKFDGVSLWTLLDSGARGTYITLEAASAFAMVKLPRAIRRLLGGRTLTIRRMCAISGTIQGYVVTAQGFVVDRLFADEAGRPIEIVLGMEAMETWGIGLDTFHTRLDFTHYQREAVEG